MRRKPDNRRESVLVSFFFGPERFHVCYSERDGEVYEVFTHGPKVGTDLDAILATACSTISIALQSGASLGDLEQAALKLEDGTPADIVSAILTTLVKECTGS
jgi:hypothetical protein